MSKPRKVFVVGADGRDLYVASIRLRKGTIYPTDLSLTRDAWAAAVFCDANVADVVEAVALLCPGRVSFKACRPPRHYSGMFYPEAFA
jgi:hypothetical protein